MSTQTVTIRQRLKTLEQRKKYVMWTGSALIVAASWVSWFEGYRLPFFEKAVFVLGAFLVVAESLSVPLSC